MHSKRNTLTCLGSALLTPLMSSRTWGQDYPTRSIRIVVPFAPGGPVDFIARALSTRLTQILGQSVIVDNKPGASTIIGTDNVAKSNADGYSMLLVGAGSRTILPAIAKLPYDPAKDLLPLSKVAAAPQVFVVSNAFAAKGVKTLKDLVAWSKNNPGKLTVGSVGGGTITSLVGDLFKKEAGIQAVDVVYKGGAPAVTAILSGEVDFLSADISAVMPHLLSRKMTALAVTGPQRVKEISEVATVAEQGFPNLP
jgi:tripartite-type tricarboxylate transporter receptor subunit TctC